MRRSFWKVGALVAPLVPGLALAQPPAPAPPAPAPAPPAAAAPRAAAPADEPGEEADAPDPARPPPQGKGALWGVVRNAKTKEAVIEAQVTVMATQKKVQADLDGRYRLELPPGTYELRVWYEGYKAQRIQGVVVPSGKVTRLDVALPPDEKTVEEVVEIEVTPDRASPVAQIELRKNASHAGDAISAQDIARSPDRSAADAARRVVGATVVDNKYVFVRGLGERYSNALLNGTPLPSPEPDRQAVPLDIFPSLILSDINIAKTFTPDMPADFAGGSVRINTRELPRSLFVQANLWLGANTRSTFAQRLTYDGSKFDGVGIDGGARALPSSLPDYRLQKGLMRPDGSYIFPQDLAVYGRAVNSPMSTRMALTPPNVRANLAIGNTFKFAGSQEIGVIVALSYGRRFQRRIGEIIRNYNVDATTKDGLRLFNDYRADTGTDLVNWGAYTGITYAPDKYNKISVTGLHSRSSENETRVIKGFNEEQAKNLTDTRLRFQSRSLTFGQLSGTHKVKSAGEGVLDWGAFASLATADEPDTRETVYSRDTQLMVDAWDYNNTLSGSHFWAKQRETSLGGLADWTQPLVKGEQFVKLKLGVLVNRRSRTFDARRFRFTNVSTANPDIYNLPPDKLFTQQNVGSALELYEYTKLNDAYTAGSGVYAGYLMTDAWLHPLLRVTMGARVEAARQNLETFDPFAAELTKTNNELNTTDLLPAINVTVKLMKDMNIRLAATRTVARPQLRELSPFLYTPYSGALDETGNPALKRTSIYNGDVRFEVFPAPGEVLAVSGFYKQFYAPIEQIIKPTNKGTITFENAKSARVVGLEIEARKGLGFIHRAIGDLSVLANFTAVSSRVELDETQIGVQTNNTRPLQGQSPYAVNAGLDFAPETWGTRVRVLYNVFGPRIAQVGAFKAPDVYEQPRHQLDLFAAQRIGKHFEVKLTAENILDSSAQFTQTTSAAHYVLNQYKLGTTVFIGAEYTY
jgi:hypothetical protein